MLSPVALLCTSNLTYRLCSTLDLRRCISLTLYINSDLDPKDIRCYRPGTTMFYNTMHTLQLDHTRSVEEYVLLIL